MTRNILQLPHNFDAEASILGGIMMRRQCLDLPAVQALEAEDFHSPRHMAVWMAILGLFESSTPIDPVTVAAELVRVGRESVADLAFLCDLATRVPTVDNVAHYATIVADLATRRRVIDAAATVVDRLRAADDDDDLNGDAARSFALATIGAVSARSKSAATTMGVIVKRRIGQLVDLSERRARGETVMTGVPTGIPALDDKTGGYQPGIVTMIAARPGVGKSSVMLAACAAATAAKQGVHVFAFEDGVDSLADRAMAGASGVAANAIRALDLNRDEMGRLGSAMNLIASRKTWLVEEEPSLYVDDICAAILRSRVDNGTRLVVIDYVQLLKGPRATRYRASDREQELSDIGTILMKFARDHDVAILLGSQLNRDCEKRDDKRPVKSDMRGSGSLEERAKAVIILYRGSMHGPAESGDEQTTNARGESCAPYLPLDDEWAEVMELILDKNSNGPQGRIRAHWHGPTMRVS